MNKFCLAAAAALTTMLAMPAYANSNSAGSCTYEGQNAGDVTAFVRDYNALRLQNNLPVPTTAGQLAEYVVAGIVVTPQYQETIPEQCRNEAAMLAEVYRHNRWQPDTPVDQLTGVVVLPLAATFTPAQSVEPTTTVEAEVESAVGPTEAELRQTQSAAEAEREVLIAEQAALTAEIAELRRQVNERVRRGNAADQAVLQQLATLERERQQQTERLATINQRLEALNTALAAKADRTYVDQTFVTKAELEQRVGNLSTGMSWWDWTVIGVIGLLVGAMALIALLHTLGTRRALQKKANVSDLPDLSTKADQTEVNQIGDRVRKVEDNLEDLSDQIGVRSVELERGWKATLQALKPGEEKTLSVKVDEDEFEVGLKKADTGDDIFITSGVQGQPETNAVKVDHFRRIIRKAAYQARLTERKTS